MNKNFNNVGHGTPNPTANDQIIPEVAHRAGNSKTDFVGRTCFESRFESTRFIGRSDKLV